MGHTTGSQGGVSERLVRPVKLQMLVELPGLCRVALGFRQLHGTLRTLHRIGEPADLGVGGGECAKNARIVLGPQLIRLAGQFDRPRAIA